MLVLVLAVVVVVVHSWHVVAVPPVVPLSLAAAANSLFLFPWMQHRTIMQMAPKAPNVPRTTPTVVATEMCSVFALGVSLALLVILFLVVEAAARLRRGTMRKLLMMDDFMVVVSWAEYLETSWSFDRRGMRQMTLTYNKESRRTILIYVRHDNQVSPERLEASIHSSSLCTEVTCPGVVASSNQKSSH